VSIRDAIYDRLTSQGPVSNRVHLGLAPTGETLPYITMFWIDAVHDHHMGGPSGLVVRRLQVDCYAAGSPEAESVADSVRFVLDGVQGLDIGGADVRSISLEGETDVQDPPQGGTQKLTHHIRQEYGVAHQHSVPVRS